jgi:hypothetical protein
MANRSLRRAPNGSGKPTVIAVTELGSNDDSVPGEQGEQRSVVENASADDRIVDNESDSVKPIGVVDVDPDKLGEFIDARTAARTDNGDGDSNGVRTRRKRGPNKARRKEAPTDIKPLVTMVTTWASVLLKTPELMFEPEEVKTLADSYDTFCEYHDPLPALTPKRMSEVNLIATVLLLVGPRIVAIRNRKRDERKATNVTSINNRGVVGH